MLRDSLARIARDVFDDEQTMMLCTAQAQLAMLAGDADDARRWAHRGLRMNPYAATLSLVLADLSDDEALGPPAADVLRRVNEKHPTYPDVRRALIKREMRDGQVATACMRLKEWLDAEPQSPVAEQLAREIAA
jgi:lipopolysaccharide biosynthesis regulator YciM